MSHEISNNNTTVLAQDYTNDSAYIQINRERAGKYFDEIVSSAKDDRMNTKRAISASIASTACIQNQNGQVVEACQRELRNKDLSAEQRERLIATMSAAAKDSSESEREAREFQKEELRHSHGVVWWLIGGAVFCLGRAALLRVA